MKGRYGHALSRLTFPLYIGTDIGMGMDVYTSIVKVITEHSHKTRVDSTTP